MFTTREQATIILFAVFLMVVIANADLRKSLTTLLRRLCSPKLALSILCYTTYVISLVWVASQLRLWTTELLGGTLFWFLFSGIVMFFSVTKAAEDERFFRKAALKALSIGAFITFFVNIYPFSVPIEVVLQLVLLGLVILQVVAHSDETYRITDRSIGALLGAIGVGLVVITVVNIAARWHHDAIPIGRMLALPIWLTVASLPFVYLVALYLEYELAFLRMYFVNDRNQVRLQSRIAVLIGTHVRLKHVHGLRGAAVAKVVAASSFQDALAGVRKIRARHPADK
jgi:hypothetical protein